MDKNKRRISIQELISVQGISESEMLHMAHEFKKMAETTKVIYDSYIGAGFTEEQSLTITMNVLINAGKE